MSELKKIWAIAGYKPLRFMIITVKGCIVNLMMVAMGMIYGTLINMVSNNLPLNKLIWYIVGSLAFVIIYCLLRWQNNYSLDKYVNYLVATFRTKYINGLLNTKICNIINENSAKYLNNLETDIEKVVMSCTYNLYRAIVCITTVIGSFIAVLVVNWKILLMMLGFVVIMSILPLFIKKRLDKSILEVSKQKQSFVAVIKEYILGISTVRNFRAEEKAEAAIDKESKNLCRYHNLNAKIDDAAGGLGVLVRELAVVSLIALTCYFVYTKEVEIGAVLTVFTVGSSFFSAILSVSAVVTYLFSMKSLRESVFEIINAKKVVKNQDISFEDKVVLKDLYFNYPNSEEKQILCGLSATFEKNKKYLILGKSGSGKSTLLKMLTAEYQPNQGNISIDGVSYDNYNEKDINEVIAISRQQCYIFNRTLRNNIDFLQDGNKELLDDIIYKVRLTDFVERLPNGLETILDEEVNQVSGGEKLRINLARALYRKSQILLLDEVTSALDKTTSEAVENALLDIKDKTVINVSHKFNDKTLPIYDMIYIIEDGRVVCEGDFEQIKSSDILSKYRNVSDN